MPRSSVKTSESRFRSGILGEDIKWNITKFLVSRDGKVIKKYASAKKPEKIEKDILKLL